MTYAERMALKERIEARLLDMTEARKADADFIMLSCFEPGCPWTSDQVAIKGIPRELWSELLTQAARGWGVDPSGDFVCAACEKERR